MFKGHTHVSRKTTPQSSPLIGEKQVLMRSGGYGFEVDDWEKLRRFLILGTEGGTYYASEKELTVNQCEAVIRLLQGAEGKKVVDLVVEISESGRAPKNDPALFVLALCAKLGGGKDDKLGIREHAYKALPKVARIGTHLFHFMAYATAIANTKCGSGFKRAIAHWYLDKSPRELATQVIKYQSRDGWSHRDVLRLGRPKAEGLHQSVLRYAVKGRENGLTNIVDVPAELHSIWAWEKAKTLGVGDTKEIVELIHNFNLPHECVPNDFKDNREVWAALSAKMGPTAMLRNLNKMTSVGLLSNTNSETNHIVKKLTDLTALKIARVHPMAILTALKVYESGHGVKGNLTWSPVRKIVDALSDAFYISFGAVRPTGKRLCLALDVSGSMGSNVAGSNVLSCREAAAAMALITANVEKDYEIVGYTAAGGNPLKSDGRRGYSGMSEGISTLSISPKQRLDDVVRYLDSLPMGSTDCALPFLWATKNELTFDAFISYTDNESWAGKIHVKEAIREHRNRMNVPAKAVFAAFAVSEYSVADPDDAGQMNVVGLDAATPIIISDFVSGRHL